MMPSAKMPACWRPPPEKTVSSAAMPPPVESVLRLQAVQPGLDDRGVHPGKGDVHAQADDDDQGEGEKNAVPEFGDFPSVGECGNHGGWVRRKTRECYKHEEEARNALPHRKSEINMKRSSGWAR